MTEIPDIKHRLDWITLTKKGYWAGVPNAAKASSMIEALSIARQSYRELGINNARLEQQLPGRGYHYGFRCLRTGVKLSVAADLENQGVMAVYSGQVLADWPEQQTAAFLALDSKWRCSRLDIAFDVFHSTVSTMDVAERYFEAHAEGAKRVTQLINGITGDTFYIGSRTSEKMLRVYDKGKKEGTGLDWIRIELELKGQYIHNASSTLLENPIIAVADVLNLLDAPKSAIYNLLVEYAGDAPAAQWKGARPKSNREVWFMTQVVKAFANLLADDPVAARRVLDALNDVVAEGASVNLVN